MISIVQTLYELNTIVEKQVEVEDIQEAGTNNIDPADAKPVSANPLTNRPTPGPAGVPLKSARYNIPGANAVKDTIQKAEVNPVSVAKKTADQISGSEAAGIAAQKGMKAAGDAGGSIAKKAAEFAGEHPVAAGVVGGAAAAYGLRKIFNKNSKSQSSSY